MPEEVPKQEIKIEPIHALRTYQGDVEEAMAKNKTSAVDIFTAEQKRKSENVAVNPKETLSSAKNKFFVLIGSILLALGIITVISVYYNEATKTVEIEPKTKTLLNFSKEIQIPIGGLTRDKLLETLINEKVSFNLPVNSVLYLNTTKSKDTPATVQEMLKLIAPQMPSNLVRSFDEKYMIGVYSFDTNEPFMIISTKDYASSFSGMLTWENNAVNDLKHFFGIQMGTTTPAFVDVEYRNKDLRLIKGPNNKTVLLYSFINKNTLLITKNEDIFKAIISKYLVSVQTR